MKTSTILLFVAAVLTLSAFAVSQLGLEESLHGTREGKAYFYSEAQGGFETLTGIPMSDLSCQNCHAPTLADGTPVDGATYEPSCGDCHDFPGQGGPAVQDSTCLGCHGRQGAEKTLSGNPNLGPMFADVHASAGFMCTTCHGKEEFPVIHGDDDTVYNSMLEPGAAHAD